MVTTFLKPYEAYQPQLAIHSYRYVVPYYTSISTLVVRIRRRSACRAADAFDEARPLLIQFLTLYISLGTQCSITGWLATNSASSSSKPKKDMVYTKKVNATRVTLGMELLSILK